MAEKPPMISDPETPILRPPRMHDLLAYQLKRYFGDISEVPEPWRGLLDSISDSYWESEGERQRLERRLDLLSSNRDAAAWARAQEDLEQSLSLLQATLESTADGILVVDRDGQIVAYNRKFVEIWRIPDGILRSGEEERTLEYALEQVVDSDTFLSKVLELHRDPEAESQDLLELRDGRWVERYSTPQRLGGYSVGRVWSFRDVTEHKRAEEAIRHHAYHDDLTGLPNRLLFKDRLRQAMGQAQRSRKPLAVLIIDLDRFKTINDTLGHAVGDCLLQEVAARLIRRRRAGDTVARPGGDEFLMLVQNLRHGEDAAKVAARLLDVLRPPVYLAGHELHVNASIGISVSPHDGADVETLIKHADVAMYRAKAEGRNHYCIFAPEMNERALETLMLENRLRRALERRELELHYQPQILAHDGRIAGVEALVRWRSEGRLVSPDEFIGTAEDSGQIIALGEWVLGDACRQSRVWCEAGLPPVRLAVNLSAHQFQGPLFLDHLDQQLEASGFEPRRLELELTESAILRAAGEGLANLRRLRERGIRIAVDDFGTGHSSLAYLKQLPITTLKIDRSFIRDCHRDPQDGAIVGAIISMAHSLGLEVVAEGVEEEAQVHFLRRHDCDELQGYYFSRPVAPEALTEILRRGVIPVT